MALTNAQMQAILAAGGSVSYRGTVYTSAAALPSDATISADTLADEFIARGGNISQLAVALTAAQIIAMGTTPVTLIAAPGAGRCIVVDCITLTMTTTATAFTGGGAVEFRYTDASGAKVSADIASAVVTAGAGTSYTTVRGVTTSLTGVANSPIVIRNATAAFAAGTGTAVVTLQYHIV